VTFYVKSTLVKGHGLLIAIPYGKSNRSAPESRPNRSDRKYDDGESILEHLDLTSVKRQSQDLKDATATEEEAELGGQLPYLWLRLACRWLFLISI
jgi:hypothetical protein